MQQEIIDLINSQRICVLAIEMIDGSPHASAVHYAFDDKSITFFFETHKTYRKAEVLLNKEIVRASVVIGFDEVSRKTLQLDGEARLIKSEEKELFDKVYMGKFPDKKDKSSDPTFAFFSFAPNWWRYTDWTGPDGKRIIVSEEK